MFRVWGFCGFSGSERLSRLGKNLFGVVYGVQKGFGVWRLAFRDS